MPAKENSSSSSDEGGTGKVKNKSKQDQEAGNQKRAASIKGHNAVNSYLRNIIWGVHTKVTKLEKCLGASMPAVVTKKFKHYPRPKPFKLDKPSGLSACLFALNLTISILGLILLMFAMVVDYKPDLFNSMITKAPGGEKLHFEYFDVGRFFGGYTKVIACIATVVLLLGYLGSIGIILGQSHMLKAYVVIFGIILIIQVLALGALFLNRRTIYDDLGSYFKNQMSRNYYGPNNTSSHPFSPMWDWIQVYFGCCGALSHDDFFNTPWFRGNSSNVTTVVTKVPEVTWPLSCCESLTGSVAKVVTELKDPTCQYKNASLQNKFTSVPCMEAITTTIKGQALMIVGAVLSFLGLEVSVVTNGLAIIKEINKNAIKYWTNKKKERQKKKKKKNTKEEELTSMVSDLNATVYSMMEEIRQLREGGARRQGQRKVWKSSDSSSSTISEGSGGSALKKSGPKKKRRKYNRRQSRKRRSTVKRSWGKKTSKTR